MASIEKSDITLQGWREISAAKFGESSGATVLLDYKIAAFGANEPVPISETDGLKALRAVHLKAANHRRSFFRGE